VKRQPFRLPDMRLETRFYEAKPPLAPAEALLEANRCLYCYDAPCVKACPTGIDIPTFIRKIATGNLTGAARTIFQANLLGLSTSRVCPVEELCVGACVYQRYGEQPIAIGRLQRFATETYLNGDASQPRALFTPRLSDPVTDFSEVLRQFPAGRLFQLQPPRKICLVIQQGRQQMAPVP